MNRIIAIKGKEQKIFPNAKTCCDYFGFNRNALSWLINEGFEYQGYYFDFLEEPEREYKKPFVLPKE